MCCQHQGRVALRKFEWTIEIDIGNISELGQRITCDPFKDNSKMACFTWHFPYLVSLLHPLETCFSVSCLIVGLKVKEYPGSPKILRDEQDVVSSLPIRINPLLIC